MNQHGWSSWCACTLWKAEISYILKRETGLSWGNLSVQISKLEAAGYVVVKKEFAEKRPHTVVALTEKGRSAFEEYRSKMQNFVA